MLHWWGGTAAFALKASLSFRPIGYLRGVQYDFVAQLTLELEKMKSAMNILSKSAALALVLCSLSSGATAQDRGAEHRSAFRKAVADYQMFVVPHCAPDHVRAYVDARKNRDQAFQQSLGNTVLKADYDRAVSEQAERDRQIIYECAFPPPPPGAIPLSPEQVRLEHEQSLIRHFEGGDRQFARIVQLREMFTGLAGD